MASQELEATLASIAASLAMIAEVLSRTNGRSQIGPDLVHIAGQEVRRDGDKFPATMWKQPTQS